MSLIGWIIIAMIVVTVIAVIVTVWSSKMGDSIKLYATGLFAVVCSLFDILFGSDALANGQTADQGTITVVGIVAAVAIILTIVQLGTCWVTYSWQESHSHG